MDLGDFLRKKRQPASNNRSDDTDDSSDDDEDQLPFGGEPPPTAEMVTKTVGSAAPLPRPDVDIGLYPSRDTPVAGELWSMAGEIHNRSDRPIWLVRWQTVLTPAPEMWGQTSERGSIRAFFPTTSDGPLGSVVRLDPDSKYNVIWKIDPHDTKNKGAGRRIGSALRNFIFFSPGTFRVSASVHIWQNPPVFDGRGMVANLGDAAVVSASRPIAMDPSPWVMILGASLGGLLCLLVQLLFRHVGLSGSVGHILQAILIALGSSVLLPGVVTVLLSRLGSTEFIVVIRVRDIWGAMATGIAVQWVGYQVLVKLLQGVPGGTS